MALTVEDGSQIANADTYVSLSEANLYFSERGNPATWANAQREDQEAALRYACVSLESMYVWTGEVVSEYQTRSWPRSGASDRDGRIILWNVIDQRIKDAQCELALLHISNPINASYDRSGAIKSEQVGPLKTEYFAGASTEPELPYIDRIIGGLGTKIGGLMGSADRA